MAGIPGRHATPVNPLLPSIEAAGFSGYLWAIDRCGYATDILFRDRAALEAIREDPITAPVTAPAASDAAEATRRTHRTSRLTPAPRGHGLIGKLKNSRPYRIDPRGYKAMGSAVRFRKADFPNRFRDLQAALVSLAA